VRLGGIDDPDDELGDDVLPSHVGAVHVVRDGRSSHGRARSSTSSLLPGAAGRARVQRHGSVVSSSVVLCAHTVATSTVEESAALRSHEPRFHPALERDHPRPARPFPPQSSPPPVPSDPAAVTGLPLVAGRRNASRCTPSGPRVRPGAFTRFGIGTAADAASVHPAA
jgi:hypothetical protein